MEIWNSGCAIECNMDTDNGMYWDELLGQGQLIYAVATDDGHPMYQHCKGWVMVNAENNVKSILSALKKGEFYSSCGPEIYDFYVEDGKVHIECSPVCKVRLHSDGHATKMKVAGDERITTAEINLDKFPYNYVRVSVVDEDGKMAWTNPIFFTDN